MEFKDDGTRSEREWKRGSWLSKLGLSSYFRRGESAKKSEQDRVTERSRLLA